MLRLITSDHATPSHARTAPAATNALLAALTREDAAAITAHSQSVLLRAGDVAILADSPSALWLPETAVLSFGETLAERHVECGVVGAEGAIGWEPLAGAQQSGQRLAALIGGTARVIAGDAIARLSSERPAIVMQLLRYRETLLVQMRWTIASRLQNGPDRRLARWLCMLHDRIEGDTLDITHLRLAAFLNARRASITDSLHVLEGERIVRCTRGRISVRNRSALEEAAGPAYGTPEQAYADLFGKSLQRI